MAEYAMPRCDEPFDFRRQAATYACFRPDYAPALYEAIAARTGPGAGRLALDLGCGPGLVAGALARRGWQVVGVDFSAPMLAEARRTGVGAGWVQARAEALPLRAGAVALVTCGTAFHWFAPAPTLAEMARVLAPGGWAAIFWQFPAPGDPSMTLLREVFDDLGIAAPDVLFAPPAPLPPFAGSAFVAEPPLLFAAEHAFTPEALVGWVGRSSGCGGRRVRGTARCSMRCARCSPPAAFRASSSRRTSTSSSPAAGRGPEGRRSTAPAPPTPHCSSSYGPPRSSARWYAGRAWIRSRNAISRGRLASRPPRAAAASSGKLIWMSAAVKSLPANHTCSSSARSMKSRWSAIWGSMNEVRARRAIARAIGRTTTGIGAVSTRLNTSLSSSGGMAEPSA